MNRYNIGIIISIVFFILFIILAVVDNKILSVSSLLVSIIMLFNSLSNLYQDNYSIEQLVQLLQLNRGDSLSYEFNIKQGLKRCRIKGQYENENLQIDEIKSPENKKHDLCPDIKKYTELKFIGYDWPINNPFGKRKIYTNFYN